MQKEHFSDKYKIKLTQSHLFIAFQMFPENSKLISKPRKLMTKHDGIRFSMVNI